MKALPFGIAVYSKDSEFALDLRPLDEFVRVAGILNDLLFQIALSV